MPSIVDQALTIVDTTLREGLQSPGVSLSIDQRVVLARSLVEAGVGELEIGAPIAGRRDQDAVREILSLGLPARLLTWNRALPGDVEASLELGVRSLYVSAPVSDLHIQKKLSGTRGKVIENLSGMVELARAQGCYVVAGLEDATRADPLFLDEVCAMLTDSRIDRIRLADTVGILTPERSQALFADLSRRYPVAFESHAHNDFGLANANTIAAWTGGASHLDTTLLGVGERAGNAPLEEVVLTLSYLYGVETGFQLHQLQKLVSLFSEMSGVPIPAYKSGVGRHAFSHASGLHIHGVTKDPSTYEPFDPQEIGHCRSIILSARSGRAAVMNEAARLGHPITAALAEEILGVIKNSTTDRTISDEEFLHLLETLGGQSEQRKSS